MLLTFIFLSYIFILLYLKTLFNPQRNGFVCLLWDVDWWEENVECFIWNIVRYSVISWGSRPSRKGDGSFSEVSKPSGSVKARPEEEAAGQMWISARVRARGHFCWQGGSLS